VQLALVLIVSNAASSCEEGWGPPTVVHLGILRRKETALYLIDGAGCSKKVFYE
jgi:hypothetical protein